MIVVATEDFELYHDLVNGLRERELEFTTIQIGESIPADARVVLAGPEDPIPEDAEVPVLTAPAEESRGLIEDAIAKLDEIEGRTVIGVDPGAYPGIAILRGNRVVSAFQVPIEKAVERIEAEVGDDPDAIVRVGDGARLMGTRLINDLDVPVELVDETGTTPYLGTGATGAGDILAAVNIASRPGEPIDQREVNPTASELSRIQQDSREQSPQNREITSGLAEQVATGELTLEEALERHREDH